jgi:hypothetical protein
MGTQVYKSQMKDIRWPPSPEATPQIMSQLLTPRGAEILRRMRDAPEGTDDEELVYADRVGGFLGSEPVARRTVFRLIRLCAVSLDQFSKAGEGLERYTISETGRAILAEYDQNIKPAKKSVL